MSTSKPKPPMLQRLKGSYIIPDDLRNNAHLNSSILTTKARDWSDPKIVIDSYLCNSQSSSAPLALLSEYVKNLVTFYKNEAAKYDVCQLYQQAELRRRVDRNNKDTELQAESTMSALMTQKGKEKEESIMIPQKRQLVEDPFESTPLTDKEQMSASDSHESSFKLREL
ncbi:unnamed protein product [Mucor fragilis]